MQFFHYVITGQALTHQVCDMPYPPLVLFCNITKGANYAKDSRSGVCRTSR